MNISMFPSPIQALKTHYIYVSFALDILNLRLTMNSLRCSQPACLSKRHVEVSG